MNIQGNGERTRMAAANGLALGCAILACLFAAACGGGYTSTPSPGPGPTPQGKYSTASLNGTYGFIMSGTDGSGLSIARV